jgi:ABC-type multidrug transport system fused ATPase/permease subunit
LPHVFDPKSDFTVIKHWTTWKITNQNVVSNKYRLLSVTFVLLSMTFVLLSMTFVLILKNHPIKTLYLLETTFWLVIFQVVQCFMTVKSDFESHTQKYESHAQKYESHTQKYESHTQKYESHTQKYESHTQKYESHTQRYESHTQKYESHTQKYEMSMTFVLLSMTFILILKNHPIKTLYLLETAFWLVIFQVVQCFMTVKSDLGSNTWGSVRGCRDRMVVGFIATYAIYQSLSPLTLWVWFPLMARCT